MVARTFIRHHRVGHDVLVPAEGYAFVFAVCGVRVDDYAEDNGAGVADDSDDDLLTIAFGSAAAASIAAHCRHAFRAGPRKRLGSLPGRRSNRLRDFDVGYRAILRDYFGIDSRLPVYSDKDFERRFRVPRSVLNCIYEATKEEPFWSRRINATGQPQIYPLQKLVAAFRVLAYGETYDRSDEYTRLSRSTVAVATIKLVEFIVQEYSPMYLRPLNDAELAHILHRNAQRGMPGCICSIDCSHWPWRQCPRGQAGQYQDYKGRRSVTMETVCDEDLFIWHFFIGCAGSNDDLNVLRQSPLYHRIMSGTWLPDRLECLVIGRSRRLLYYLADGIYPPYAVFARPYGTAITPQQRTYNRLQKALRTDVERVFDVMTNRFHIVLYPARFSTVTRLTATGRAIAILHNMVIRERRDGFLSRRRIAAVGGVPASVPLGTPGTAVGAGSAAAGNVGPWWYGCAWVRR